MKSGGPRKGQGNCGMRVPAFPIGEISVADWELCLKRKVAGFVRGQKGCGKIMMAMAIVL
jgi:hypothetical protein